MNLIDLLKFVGLLLWRQVLQTILVTLTFGYLILSGGFNIITVVLSVLVWRLVFKLWKEIDDGEKPVFYSWLGVILFTSGITLLLYLLFYFIGGYGFVGLLIFLLGMAGVRIWQNWKLYDAVTTWGAKRIKGEVVESFNIEEVLTDGRRKE